MNRPVAGAGASCGRGQAEESFPSAVLPCVKEPVRSGASPLKPHGGKAKVMTISLATGITPFERALTGYAMRRHTPDDRGRCVLDFEERSCIRHRRTEVYRRRLKTRQEELAKRAQENGPR